MTDLPDNALILSDLDRDIDGLVPGHVVWSRWTDRGVARWFVPTYLTCGDYNNSGLVERSNLRVFREQFASGEGRWWLSVSGGYGTDAVVVRTLAYRVMAEVREFFDALSQYPLADEEDHSALEQETQAEDWDSYGRDDWRRAMTQSVEAHWEEQPDDVAERASAAIETLTDEQLDALYHELCEVTGSYPESESSGGASLFREAAMAAEWAGRGRRRGSARQGRLVPWEVPRLVAGAVSYACGDVVAWRGLLDTTDEVAS